MSTACVQSDQCTVTGILSGPTHLSLKARSVFSESLQKKANVLGSKCGGLCKPPVAKLLIGTHIHIHTHINTHLHTHKLTHIYTNILKHTHIHTFIYIYIYIYIHTHTHRDTHTSVCVCVHMVKMSNTCRFGHGSLAGGDGVRCSLCPVRLLLNRDYSEPQCLW